MLATKERAVSEEEALQVSEYYNMEYFETSAKEDIGVNEAYMRLNRKILDKVLALEEKGQILQPERKL